MDRFGKRLIGVLKKVMVSSSSCSRGGSSMCYTEPEEILMHEDGETVPTEEQEQEQLMEEGDDKTNLDLEGE